MRYVNEMLVVCVVIADGLLKKEKPGSLWEPAVTHLWPSNWLALPLAYGLMASPWGAHSVFPSVGHRAIDLDSQRANIALLDLSRHATPS